MSAAERAFRKWQGDETRIPPRERMLLSVIGDAIRKESQNLRAQIAALRNEVADLKRKEAARSGREIAASLRGKP